MKKWNVFKVYAEDSKDVYKLIIPSSSKKEAEKYVESGGLEVIKIVELENMKINTDYLSQILTEQGFDTDGIDVICRTIQMVGLSCS